MQHPSPVGIWCQNEVVSTSMRRSHVASTLLRRHFTPCARWGIRLSIQPYGIQEFQ